MSKYDYLKPTTTPKEKAIQLINAVSFSINSVIDYQTGRLEPGPHPTNPYRKHCALVVVNEILKFMEEDDKLSETAYWCNHPYTPYWVNVKKEIEKI